MAARKTPETREFIVKERSQVVAKLNVDELVTAVKDVLDEIVEIDGADALLERNAFFIELDLNADILTFEER